MSETMTTTKRIIRKAATAAVITMAVSSPAAEAKKPNKVIAKAQAATAYRPIVPTTVEQCVSASTGKNVNFIVKNRTPKSPVSGLEARNPGKECDDIATQANVYVTRTERVTLYEKMKNKLIPLGRVAVDALIFPRPNDSGSDRDIHATGKMRLAEPLCQGSKRSYELVADTIISVENGTPAYSQSMPTIMRRETPFANEVDTVGPPLENPTIADLADVIATEKQSFAC